VVILVLEPQNLIKPATMRNPDGNVKVAQFRELYCASLRLILQRIFTLLRHNPRLASIALHPWGERGRGNR
jgi:hypothetical protein